MKILWYIIWTLIIAQFIVIPFWPRIVRRIMRNRPTRKFWRSVMKCGIYSAIPALLITSIVCLATTSLRIAKNSVKTGKSEFKSAYVSREQSEYTDVRGQIHVHCYLSHDSEGGLDEITDAAEKNGVKWIILTDHIGHLPDGSYPDKMNGVLLIYGCERNYSDKTSVLRASLKDPKETLFLHGHIEKFGSRNEFKWVYQKDKNNPVVHWDALEMVNFHANILNNKLGVLGSVFFTPEKLYENIVTLIPENFVYWQELARREDHPIPIFGAPDAHQNQKYLGIQVDPYELMLGMISTHIWIRKDQKLNQATIFEAIKAGRTYIAFEQLGDPTGFHFSAIETTETYRQELLTGSTAKAPKYITVTVPRSLDVSPPEIKFFRDNQPIAISAGNHTQIKDPLPGFWRVEIWKNEKPWIISGQILVK